MAEKQRMVEKNEQVMQQQAEQQQQQQQQMQEQQLQAQMQQLQAQNQQADMLNQRDNETKILVAEIQAQAKIEASDNSLQDMKDQEAAARKREELSERIRQADGKQALSNERLQFDREKAEKQLDLQRRALNKRK